ncbi:UbiA family prenyltransferase [Desulfocastanea catecholica]
MLSFLPAIKRRYGLAKVPLCLLVGCSTVFGYILADPVVTPRTFFAGCGIFVIAAGAATLNSLQEYRLDGQLGRTRNRPMPQGLLTPAEAGMQALVLLFIGLGILFTAGRTLLPPLVAVCAVFLYNAVYTPLKKKTILAIIPGAICGALPPYIGWLGGGGKAVGFTAALLIVLFVLWQVPHFWLVQLTFKEDYAGSDLPNFLKQFREDSLKRFFATWIGALVTVMLMFLILPFPLGWFFRAIIIGNACLLPGAFFYGLAIRKMSDYRRLFIVLNLALFVHMATLAAGRALT